MFTKMPVTVKCSADGMGLLTPPTHPEVNGKVRKVLKVGGGGTPDTPHSLDFEGSPLKAE